MTRFLAPCLVGLVLLAVCPLSSEGRPPTDDPAERLHHQATEAAKRGAFREAAELWREAERIRPEWKYSYNLARALYEIDAWAEGWRALERAEKRGTPDKYRTHLAGLRARLSGAMLREHAWIELVVDPPDARVTRNGVDWPAGERAA